MTALSAGDRPSTVLYLAGAGRSGGTIVSSILGNQPGFFYAGELRDLWTSGLRHEKMCGCGKRVVDCDVWQAIFQRAYGGLDAIDTAEMTRLRDAHSRTHRLGAALLMRASGRTTASQRLYVDRLRALHNAIRDVTGCRVIVDASRLASYGLFVSAIPDIAMCVVQLIRDPRAVAFSWTRKRRARTATREVDLRQQSVARSAIDWNAQNLSGELLWHRVARASMFMRYEDIVRDPAAGLGRILALTGEPELRIKFAGPNTYDLAPNHSVAGNAYRTQTGPVTLTLDDEWRAALPVSARRLVALLCWPGMLRYGYGPGPAA